MAWNLPPLGHLSLESLSIGTPLTLTSGGSPAQEAAVMDEKAKKAAEAAITAKRPGAAKPSSSETEGARALAKLISNLENENSALRSSWEASFKKNMLSKKAHYDRAAIVADQEAAVELREINLYYSRAQWSAVEWEQGKEVAKSSNRPKTDKDGPLIDKAAGGKWDLVKDKTSDRYQSAMRRAAAIRKISSLAEEKAHAGGDYKALMVQLTRLKDYNAQSLVLEKIVEMVRAFAQESEVGGNTFFNIILMGNPGTGKSRMAAALARTLSLLGFFVYDNYVEASASDFLGEYVGQTAIKTKTFLTVNLERVIFLDEAYALTQYDDDEYTQLGQYSREAVAELIAFMQREIGRSSLIAAGYEDEIRTQFLPANEGFQRRFQIITTLQDYDLNSMCKIFVTQLSNTLRKSKLEVCKYFTPAAWIVLKKLIEAGREKTTTKDEGGNVVTKWTYPHLHDIFAAQAGAMTNLASTTGIKLRAIQMEKQLVGFVGIYELIQQRLEEQFAFEEDNVTDDVAKEAAAARPQSRRSNVTIVNDAAEEPKIVAWKLGVQEMDHALMYAGIRMWEGYYKWDVRGVSLGMDKTPFTCSKDVLGEDDYLTEETDVKRPEKPDYFDQKAADPKPKDQSKSTTPCVPEEMGAKDSKGINFGYNALFEWATKYEHLAQIIDSKEIIDIVDAENRSGDVVDVNELAGDYIKLAEYYDKMMKIADDMQNLAPAMYNAKVGTSDTQWRDLAKELQRKAKLVVLADPEKLERTSDRQRGKTLVKLLESRSAAGLVALSPGLSESNSEQGSFSGDQPQLVPPSLTNQEDPPPGRSKRHRKNTVTIDL